MTLKTCNDKCEQKDECGLYGQLYTAFQSFVCPLQFSDERIEKIEQLESENARLKALCRDLWKQLDEQIDYHDLEARIKQEGII